MIGNAAYWAGKIILSLGQEQNIALPNFRFGRRASRGEPGEGGPIYLVKVVEISRLKQKVAAIWMHADALPRLIAYLNFRYVAQGSLHKPSPILDSVDFIL